MRFEVKDEDGKGKSDLIGVVETTLGTIVGSQGQQLTLDLKRSGSDISRGKIILSIDVVRDSNTEVHMRFSGRNIAGVT